MAWVVIASPDSASTLAAASRALVFLGLGSFGAFLALVFAGAAASGATGSGVTSSGTVASAGVDSGSGCSGVGGAAASRGVSPVASDSGWTGGSVAAGAWTSGASAGLRPFFCVPPLLCGLGDCLLVMVGSPRCG